MIYEEKESYAASRCSGLGGTDMAAVLNLSPWKRPIEVYAGKVNPTGQPELDKECLYWGTALEPIVRGRYQERYGIQVMAPNDLGLVFPKSRPWRDSTLIEGAESWMLGAPDGWMPAVNSGLEVKCSARKGDEWGEEGSDDVPVHYFVQVSWYMAVCNADAWNFATLFSGNKLEQFRIVRDTGFEHDLIEAGRAFWFDNVLKQVEPDIDESESYGKYLARKFSLNTGKIINDPSQEILDWTEKMKTAEETERQAAADKQLANNHLRALIGDAQKAITPLGSMGWVRPKEGESTDWKAAAERLSALYEDARSADAVPAADVIKEATSPEHRSAYLRAWWAKKKDKVFAEAGEF